MRGAGPRRGWRGIPEGSSPAGFAAGGDGETDQIVPPDLILLDRSVPKRSQVESGAQKTLRLTLRGASSGLLPHLKLHSVPRARRRAGMAAMIPNGCVKNKLVVFASL